MGGSKWRASLSRTPISQAAAVPEWSSGTKVSGLPFGGTVNVPEFSQHDIERGPEADSANTQSASSS